MLFILNEIVLVCFIVPDFMCVYFMIMGGEL